MEWSRIGRICSNLDATASYAILGTDASSGDYSLPAMQIFTIITCDLTTDATEPKTVVKADGQVAGPYRLRHIPERSIRGRIDPGLDFYFGSSVFAETWSSS